MISSPSHLRHARGELLLDRCLVMGILNRTPDSFYDGGRMSLQAAVEHGVRMVDEGADVIDVGAVKAGPGAEVTAEEEVTRLLPLVKELARAVDVPLSIETSRPEVARAAIDAGAAIVNDVTGGVDPALAKVAADSGAALVLMHSGGQIRGRPLNPRYEQIVEAVTEEWSRLAREASEAGVDMDRMLVDPGLDFGKNTFHSLALMRRLEEMCAGPFPVLVAASRKDVVGETLDLPVGERLEGSLALAVISVVAGAAMLRVHDVRETVRAVRMTEAVQGKIPPAAPLRGLWE
jgi:dihydropteroate synthase